MAFNFDRVQKDIRKLRNFLKRTPKRPGPEEIHSLRTHTRRVQSALRALALDSSQNERRLLRELEKLRRKAGKVRDLDVLTGHVANVRMKNEGPCLVQLLEHLGAEHARRSRQLHSLTVENRAALLRRLKGVEAKLGKLAEKDTPDKAAPAEAMISELQLQRELGGASRLIRENLHLYRLKVKELRYILQMEDDPSDSQLIETLGEIKDAIGEWHDWQKLLGIAQEELPHGKNCKLVGLLQTIAGQKFRHALSVAERGRKHALRPFAPPDA
ncbi:MAG: CHAD domain-containing protein [Acidobacteriaceae bacterium]